MAGAVPTSRCAGVGPAAPPTSSICGAAPAKPVNHAHIKAPTEQALTNLAAGSERTVPAQMFSCSFSQLQRAAESTRKHRSPVQRRGRSKEPTHPLQLHGPAQTSTPPPPAFLAPVLHYPTSPSSPRCGCHLLSAKSESSLEKPPLAGLHGHRGELRQDHTRAKPLELVKFLLEK